MHLRQVPSMEPGFRVQNRFETRFRNVVQQVQTTLLMTTFEYACMPRMTIMSHACPTGAIYRA
jgi:hypothetical protein